MKKFFAFALIFAAFSLVACGGEQKKEDNNKAKTEECSGDCKTCTNDTCPNDVEDNNDCTGECHKDACEGKCDKAKCADCTGECHKDACEGECDKAKCADCTGECHKDACEGECPEAKCADCTGDCHKK